jgi:hypothetical protein
MYDLVLSHLQPSRRLLLPVSKLLFSKMAAFSEDQPKKEGVRPEGSQPGRLWFLPGRFKDAELASEAC